MPDGDTRRRASPDPVVITLVSINIRGAAHADRVVFLADGRLVGELLEPTADSVLEQMKRLGG